MPTEYTLLVFHRPDGWRKFAMLPATLGFRFVCMIAEESQLAWIAPIRVVRDGETVMELDAAGELGKAA